MADSVYLTNPFGGGGSGGGITIGTTTITGGTTTRVLYDNAGVVGEYAVTGSGTTAVLSTAPTLTGPVTVTGAAGSAALTITGATQTASFPASDVTQTWNNGAVVFTARRLNVTNTASDAASLLEDWQVGGVSVSTLRANGTFYAGTGTSGSGAGFRFFAQPNLGMYLQATNLGAGSNVLVFRSANGIDFCLGGGQGRFKSDLSIGFGSGSPDSTTSDAMWFRDAANTIAQRNGTNAQTRRLYETYTDASNYERAAFTMGSDALTIAWESAGTGAANGDIALTPKGTGRLRYNVALVALGGGAAPTLGTIGGSGPATAAQNSWLELKDSTGASTWIPVWK